MSLCSHERAVPRQLRRILTQIPKTCPPFTTQQIQPVTKARIRMPSNPIPAGSLATKTLLPLTTRPLEHLQRHRLIEPAGQSTGSNANNTAGGATPGGRLHIAMHSPSPATLPTAQCGILRVSARTRQSYFRSLIRQIQTGTQTLQQLTVSTHLSQQGMRLRLTHIARRHQLRQSQHLTLQTIQLISSTTRLPQHSQFRRSQHIDRGYITHSRFPNPHLKRLRR